MRDPETVVRDFCAAWSRRDVDELLGYFTDDAVYHNMPLAPVSGKDGIRAVLNLFVPPAETIEFETLALAARGSVVFTERVDRFTIGGRQIDLPSRACSRSGTERSPPGATTSTWRPGSAPTAESAQVRSSRALPPRPRAV